MVCIAFALFQSFIFLFPLHSLSENLFNFFVYIVKIARYLVIIDHHEC